MRKYWENKHRLQKKVSYVTKCPQHTYIAMKKIDWENNENTNTDHVHRSCTKCAQQAYIATENFDCK